MIAKTAAQRVKETEARKRAAGMVRYTVWTYPECVESIKTHAARETARAERKRKT